MGPEGSACVDICELNTDVIAYPFDNLIFIEKVNFTFGRMNIDVDTLRVDFETQVWLTRFDRGALNVLGPGSIAAGFGGAGFALSLTS